MTQFQIDPSFVKIFYHSSAGSHIMTRPTRQWEGVPWESPGSYLAWDGTTEVDADEMIGGFVDLLLPLYSTDVVFDSYIIYDVQTVEGNPVNVPVWAELFVGKAGETALPVNHLAFMKTFSFLTTESHNAKIVLLDVPTGGQINKTGTVAGDELAIVNMFMSVTAAWSGRDDERPVAFRSLNNSVNKALERKYGF